METCTSNFGRGLLSRSSGPVHDYPHLFIRLCKRKPVKRQYNMLTCGEKMPAADIMPRTPSPLPAYFDVADDGMMPLPINIDSALCNSAACVTSNVVDRLRMQHGLSRLQPSILAITYNARVLIGKKPAHTDTGFELGQACDAVRLYGACPNNQWPFSYATYAVKPPAIRDTTFFSSAPIRAKDIKAVLVSGLPVMCTLKAYESFESLETATSHIVPVPHPQQEALLGGYSILITGFCDTLQAFLCQDCASTFFGTEGRFALSYRQAYNPENVSDFWSMHLYR